MDTITPVLDEYGNWRLSRPNGTFLKTILGKDAVFETKLEALQNLDALISQQLARRKRQIAKRDQLIDLCEDKTLSSYQIVKYNKTWRLIFPNHNGNISLPGGQKGIFQKKEHAEIALEFYRSRPKAESFNKLTWSELTPDQKRDIRRKRTDGYRERKLHLIRFATARGIKIDLRDLGYIDEISPTLFFTILFARIR